MQPEDIVASADRGDATAAAAAIATTATATIPPALSPPRKLPPQGPAEPTKIRRRKTLVQHQQQQPRESKHQTPEWDVEAQRRQQQQQQEQLQDSEEEEDAGESAVLSCSDNPAEWAGAYPTAMGAIPTMYDHPLYHLPYGMPQPMKAGTGTWVNPMTSAAFTQPTWNNLCLMIVGCIICPVACFCLLLLLLIIFGVVSWTDVYHDPF